MAAQIKRKKFLFCRDRDREEEDEKQNKSIEMGEKRESRVLIIEFKRGLRRINP